MVIAPEVQAMSMQKNQPPRGQTFNEVRNRFAAYAVLALVVLAFIAMVLATILGGGPLEAPVNTTPVMP
jgi:hypothetical protein